MPRILRYAAQSIVLLVIVPALVCAEVSRVEIVSRKDVQGGRVFGPTGPYEQIIVRLYFLVDPANRGRVRLRNGFAGPAFSVAGMVVWGFTAGLLDLLLDLGGWAVRWDAGRLLRLPADSGIPQ